MSTPDESLWLHIYGQEVWHNAVRIHGTPEAFIALAARLLAAANEITLDGAPPTYFASDGEGYTVEIIVETEASMDRLPMPYIDEAAGGSWRIAWKESP